MKRLLGLLFVGLMAASSCQALTVNCITSMEAQTLTINAGFGLSMAVGDLDGNGIKDLIISDPSYSGSQGEVYIYFGKTSGISTSYDVKLNGTGAGPYFGQSVTTGDLNNDGIDDLIVDQLNPRTAFVYFGNTNFSSSHTPNTNILTGEGVSTASGCEFTSYVEDVNADGISDLLLTAPGTSREGVVKVYFGGSAFADKTSSQNDLAITGEAYDQYFGQTVWIGDGNGDLSGDGYDDVVFSAYGWGGGYTNGKGKIYVHFAGNNFGTTQVSMEGETQGDQFGGGSGGWVSAGNIFGSSSHTDLIVSSYTNSSNTGYVKAYAGGSTISSTPAFTIRDSDSGYDNTANDSLGFRIRCANFTNSSQKDMIIVAGGAASIAGRAYYYKGPFSTGGAAPAPSDQQNGETANDRFSRIGSADVNKDGYEDLIMGAWNYNSGIGKTYLYLGGSTFAFSESWSLIGETNPNHFGTKIMMGDINGDNIDEFMVLANNSGNGTVRSKVYVYSVLTTHVAAPNGGDFVAGTTYSISWEASNSKLKTGPISLYYSTNEGTSWTTIATGEANDGGYLWTLPQVNSSLARIKVLAEDISGNQASDASNSNFTLQGIPTPVSVIAPNGYEVWKGGTTQKIKWSVTQSLVTLEVNPIYIHFSSGESESFNLIASQEANDGEYDWLVPHTERAQCRIKIVAKDVQGNTTFATSANYFSITDPVGVDPLVSSATAGPNPFNPDTGGVTIQFDLDQSGNTTLYIFDLNGNVVHKKNCSTSEQGGHIGTNYVSWDGKNAYGQKVPNGVYLYKIISGGKVGGGGKLMVVR